MHYHKLFHFQLMDNKNVSDFILFRYKYLYIVELPPTEWWAAHLYHTIILFLIIAFFHVCFSTHRFLTPSASTTLHSAEPLTFFYFPEHHAATFILFFFLILPQSLQQFEVFHRVLFWAHVIFNNDFTLRSCNDAEFKCYVTQLNHANIKLVKTLT